MSVFIWVLGFVSYTCAQTSTPDSPSSTSQSGADDVAKILEAVSKFAWPLLAGVVLFVLYPELKKIVRSRGFTVKVADMELSVQSASEQLSKQINELQEKVLRLQFKTQEIPDVQLYQPELHEGVEPDRKRILWVMDNPQNYAFAIAKLERDGVEIIKAKSTAEAIELLNLQGADIDGIVTDVSRQENGVHHPKAGLELIKKIREAEFKLPIFVLCSERNIREYHAALKAAGAIEATASSLDLIGALKVAGLDCSRGLSPNNSFNRTRN